MTLKNRRGQSSNVPGLLIALIAALLILGIYLLLTGKSKDVINDASNEVSSWINFANPNCDFDRDGLNNVADICPCNDDNTPTSRFYYLKGTKGSECTVYKNWSAAGINYERSFQQCLVDGTSCNQEPVTEANKWIYYIDDLKNKKSCIDAIINIKEQTSNANLCDVGNGDAGNGRSELRNFNDGLKSGILGSSANSGFVFPEKCAKLILAMNTELSRPTFSCVTPTFDCKKQLKNEKC